MKFMEGANKKASTRVPCMQQVKNKMNKHTATGKGRKQQREPAQRYASQIATLKANNTSLATALDELKQECRKLQQDNLQLKQERQNLLERVASLEKRLTNKKETLEVPSAQLLQEAQLKLQEVQSTLDFIVHKTNHQISFKQQSPEFKSSNNTCTPKKVLRFSTPSQSEGCTIYPRTPHPLHNMTCVVDGPRLASTPVKTKLTSSSSLNVSPQKINYSDTEDDLSSIPPTQQWQGENPANHKNPNSTLDQLEDALTCSHMTLSLPRPRRRCTSLSLSYQEPTLNRKLRRGDPFTELTTDWNPPDYKERRKKCKKSANTEKRKVLQDIKNQQNM